MSHQSNLEEQIEIIDDEEEREKNKQNKYAIGSRKLTSQEKCGVKEKKKTLGNWFIYNFFNIVQNVIFDYF